MIKENCLVSQGNIIKYLIFNAKSSAKRWVYLLSGGWTGWQSRIHMILWMCLIIWCLLLKINFTHNQKVQKVSNRHPQTVWMQWTDTDSCWIQYHPHRILEFHTMKLWNILSWGNIIRQHCITSLPCRWYPALLTQEVRWLKSTTLTVRMSWRHEDLDGLQFPPKFK